MRSLQELLPTIKDEEALRAKVREINAKITALNVMGARSGRSTIGSEMAQLYAEKLVQRLRRGNDA
ncbi:MAG: hypothetical protein M5U22_16015 [Thermoleophilia bacterium]|nr:hypothetical protein [Thermoleophilia bacterium]